MPAKNIVFFDGYCVLCNGFVDLLLKIDTRHVLFFASLQGNTASGRLPEEYIKAVDTVIFLDEKGIVSVKSEAVLNILNALGGAWKYLSVFKVIPEKIRDKIYTFIANNRYTWFGRNDFCRLPDDDEKTRILP